MILYSNIIGTGKPLLILHGFLGSGDNWKTLGTRFADEGFQVHLIDQRNHGRSFHSDAFSYSLLAEDLVAYCKKHHLKESILMGHSMGGKTAMLAASTNPQLFEKLIIVDIAPKHYPQHHQKILEGLASLNLDTLKSRSEADKHLARFVEDIGVRQFLLKNLYWVKKGQLGLRMNLPSLIDNIEHVGEALPEQNGYVGPTLFIAGAHSDYIKKEDFNAIKRHFPHSEIVTIKEAGHWVHAENTEVFFSEVINFIK